MKNSIESFVNGCLAEGCQVVNLASVRFNAALPYRPMETGCTIIVPQDVEVMSWQFADHSANFIPVQVKFPDGMLVCDKLFLGTLTKCVQGFEDGKRFYDYAKGSVNQMIRDCEDWADALNLIRGRRLKVTDIRTHHVHDCVFYVTDLDLV